MKKVILILILSCAGCAKKVDVKTPAVAITTNDRVKDVLASNLAPEQKVQVIHDLLDREQNRGQNVTGSWKETLSWLSTVLMLAVKK